MRLIEQEAAMDLVEAPWTAERFIAGDNRQEQKHEFDGVRVIPMTGGTYARQKLVINLANLLSSAIDTARFGVVQEMRLRAIALPAIGAALPLVEIYDGLSF